MGVEVSPGGSSSARTSETAAARIRSLILHDATHKPRTPQEVRRDAAALDSRHALLTRPVELRSSSAILSGKGSSLMNGARSRSLP